MEVDQIKTVIKACTLRGNRVHNMYIKKLLENFEAMAVAKAMHDGFDSLRWISVSFTEYPIIPAEFGPSFTDIEANILSKALDYVYCLKINH